MAKAEPKKPVKPLSKSQVIAQIAEATELRKPQVIAVLDALQNEIKKSLSNRGAGVFTIPGLVKIVKKKVPAKPARKNAEVRDIRTGQITIKDIPAKPASMTVRVRALKNLKSMV